MYVNGSKKNLKNLSGDSYKAEFTTEVDSDGVTVTVELDDEFDGEVSLTNLYVNGKEVKNKEFNKKFVEAVSFATEVLSGIPSIIFGLFGMIFFGELLGFKYSILTGCFTLTLLILPIIIRSTQTALASVPESYREAARGLGATKWYMIHTVILPSCLPGILTGVILAMGRIIAESAALLFTAGSAYLMPRDFFSHFLESGGTLTIQLYIAMTNAQYGQAFVIGMILIVLIFLMNALAKWITKHFDVNTKE